LWLTAERIVFGTGVVIAAMFPWFQEGNRVYGLWSFLVGFEFNPYGGFAAAWTLLTMALLVSGLATPGGMVGPKRRWATVVALALLAAGHVVVALYANSPFFAVRPTYWVLILLAAASAAVWWPREDIDEVV
jgi:hypothetical protein